MAWLSGWDKRIKLTLDKDQVDAALSNFPVMVYLSAASGIGDVDVSCVFDELTQDANRKKIAVTTSDGETQCYVEIERWDDANEKAWLHVKVPSVSNSVDTTLYLYYDSAQSDNDSYVGDTTDAVTHNVWDSNFFCVCHKAQDPNGDGADAIKESTSNGFDMTPGGTMTTADLVDGKVGKGIDFDGTDDYLSSSNPSMNFGTSGLTLECVFKTPDLEQNRAIIFRQDNGNDNNPLITMRVSDAGAIVFVVRGQTNPESLVSLTSNTAGYDDDALRYAAGVFDDPAGTAEIFMNGSSDGSQNAKTTTDVDFSSADLQIGRTFQEWIPNDDYYFDGILDEIRFSVGPRSGSWIKATYHSLWDSLITFGTEDTLIVEGSLSESFTSSASITGSTDHGKLYENLTSADAISALLEVPPYGAVRSNWSKTSGLWYFEITVSSGDYHYIGVATADASLIRPVGRDQYGWGYCNNGKKYHDDQPYAFGAIYTAGDVIGVALNVNTGKLWFSKNGVWQNSGDPLAGTGEAFSGLTGALFAMWASYYE